MRSRKCPPDLLYYIPGGETVEDKQDAAQAVNRMKAYIAAHLLEPMTARDVARAAGYSPFYAARIFKAQTRLTPFEYIRAERLSGAAHALRGGEGRVLDVALDFVFDSHEGFTRAFTKAFGISPKRFADFPCSDGWLIPYRGRLPMNKTEVSCMDDNTAVIFTQIVERPKRKLLLLRGKTADEYFAYCEEVGCDVWEVLCGVKEALYEPVGLWLHEAMRKEGTGVYAQGVELPLSWNGETPAGYEVLELNACKMLVFQGEPYDDEVFEDAIGKLWRRIERFNPQVYGYRYADELAPRMQLAPQGWRGYIEMRPVEEIK